MPKLPLVLLALSLIGACISIYQTQHFFELKHGLGGFDSFCNMSSAMNCQAVESSRYAEFIPGKPLSAFAAGGYLGLLFTVLLALLVPALRREASVWVLVGGAVAAGFSLTYLYVMSQRLGVYCILCLTVDAINFLFLLLSFLWWREERKSGVALDGTRLRNSLLPLAIGGLLLPFLVSAALNPGDPEPQEVADFVESFFNSKIYEVPAEKGLATIGPENAPIVVTKFSDFQCPSCKRGALILHPLLIRYAGQVKFVYRNYPLDQSCNRKITRPLHPYSCEAAKIGVCAREQGKFNEVYEAFFEHQEEIGVKTSPVNIGIGAGLDSKQLETCLGKPETLAKVQSDIEEGIALGVEGTPTFFVNGRKIDALYPVAVWRRIFDEILRGKK